MTSQSIPDELLDIPTGDDSELLLDLHDVLTKHDVDPIVTVSVLDIVGKWEMEQFNAAAESSDHIKEQRSLTHS